MSKKEMKNTVVLSTYYYGEAYRGTLSYTIHEASEALVAQLLSADVISIGGYKFTTDRSNQVYKHADLTREQYFVDIPVNEGGVVEGEFFIVVCESSGMDTLAQIGDECLLPETGWVFTLEEEK